MRSDDAIVLSIIALVAVVGIAGLFVGSDKSVALEEPSLVVSLDSLTLSEKIAQMIITYGDEQNRDRLQSMNIGGVYLGKKPTKFAFIHSVKYLQQGATIPFFVAIDLEGCETPIESVDFPAPNEIKTNEEAYLTGVRAGILLKELGAHINLAPVVDLEDTIWNCRSFIGSPEEISEKAQAYIAGIQEQGIIATAKHYPGKTLSIDDPHHFIVSATIDRDDLMPFERAIDQGVSAIMVSHLIVNGEVDSEFKPAVVSEKLIRNLRNKFPGLIISDDIHMRGLSNLYSNNGQKYVEVFKAGNDLILNLDTNIAGIEHMLAVVEKAVRNGEIDEKMIDDSVTRILNAKGIKVV